MHSTCKYKVVILHTHLSRVHWQQASKLTALRRFEAHSEMGRIEYSVVVVVVVVVVVELREKPGPRCIRLAESDVCRPTGSLANKGTSLPLSHTPCGAPSVTSQWRHPSRCPLARVPVRTVMDSVTSRQRLSRAARR